MTSQQIYVALAVLEAGSISKAAKKLYLAQPTVSAELAALERELGFAVFERSNKGVSLTGEGEEFFQRARRIVAEFSGIQEITKGGGVCRLRLTTFNSARVENAFETFCLRHQNADRLDISYRVAYDGLKQRVEELCDGRIDLALINTPSLPEERELQYFERRRLQYQALCRMPITVTMGASHPLCHGPLTVERAVKYPRVESVRLTEYSAFYAADVAALRESPAIQIQSRSMRLRLAAAGIGYFVGILPKQEDLKQYGLISRALPNRFLHIGFLMEKSSEKNARLREFITLVQDEFCQDYSD